MLEELNEDEVMMEDSYEEVQDDETALVAMLEEYAELSHSINRKDIIDTSNRKLPPSKKEPRSWEFITVKDNISIYKIGKTITVIDSTNDVYVRLSLRTVYEIKDGEEVTVYKTKAEAAGVRSKVWSYVGSKDIRLAKLRKLAQDITTHQLSTGEIQVEGE